MARSEAHQKAFTHLAQLSEMDANPRLFDDLTSGELDQVVAIGHVVKKKLGEYVFREGEEGNCLYVVLQGSVSLFIEQGGKEIWRPLPGDVFGEMALFDKKSHGGVGNVRSASALAMEETTLLELDYRVCLHEGALSMKLLLNIGRMLSERIRVMNVAALKMARQAAKQAQK